MIGVGSIPTSIFYRNIKKGEIELWQQQLKKQLRQYN